MATFVAMDLLQQPSGVDQDLCMVIERRARVVMALDADLPSPFVRVPERARDAVIVCNAGVQLVTSHDTFQVR